MDLVRFEVAPSRTGWAVKHNGGYLGHVRTRAEALDLARMLADWATARGQVSSLEVGDASVESGPVEPRSFTRRVEPQVRDGSRGA